MSTHPNPTDEELDRNWQPSGRRPQSTIARSFSQELVDIFKLENSIADLDESVDKRKQQVTTQNTELEALEQRIKEMEARLARSKGGAPGAPATHQRQGVAGAFDQTAAPATAAADKSSRPGTAKPTQQQAPVHGGAMPPTPTASEDGGDRDN